MLTAMRDFRTSCFVISTNIVWVSYFTVLYAYITDSVFSTLFRFTGIFGVFSAKTCFDLQGNCCVTHETCRKGEDRGFKNVSRAFLTTGKRRGAFFIIMGNNNDELYLGLRPC